MPSCHAGHLPAGRQGDVPRYGELLIQASFEPIVAGALYPACRKRMQKQFHKRIRLAKEVYALLGHACSISIGVLDRKPIFTHDPFARECRDTLLRYANEKGLRLHVFCLMPDHIHLLMEPTASESLIIIIQSIKSWLTRIAWKYGFEGSIFQKSFYDNFLRGDEDIMTVVYYILNNPVRAGLVAHWWEYPYIGSNVYLLEELKNA